MAFSGDAADAMTEIWKLLDAYFKEHRVSDRFKRLQVSMFCNASAPSSKFPKLKGRAAEVKSLAAALLHVFELKMDHGCLQHRQIRLALRMSARMEELLVEHKREIKLPTEAAAELEKCALAYLQLNTALAQHYNAMGWKIFDITIKFHYLVHASRGAKWLNPRLGWTYSGEDFMQKVRLLTQSSVRGTPMIKVGEKTLRKYVWGMTLRMSERAQWLRT